jgi:hypothetical protein
MRFALLFVLLTSCGGETAAPHTGEGGGETSSGGGEASSGGGETSSGGEASSGGGACATSDDCGSGFSCCYPCGIPGCERVCEPSCEEGRPGCANGCMMRP